MIDTRPNRETVLEHYGYDSSSEAPALGLWPNDGTALQRLEVLPYALRLYPGFKKIRVAFDYDPDYPVALLQVWGLPEITLPPDTGIPRDKPEM